MSPALVACPFFRTLRNCVNAWALVREPGLLHQKLATKRGLTRPEIRQRKLSDCLCFSWFFDAFMFLGGFNCSQMAKFDFRTYCNTFWMISGATKNVTKSGPLDPIFITKIFQKKQEQYGNILGKYYFHIWESEILGNVCVPNLLKFWNLRIWKLHKWNL